MIKFIFLLIGILFIKKLREEWWLVVIILCRGMVMMLGEAPIVEEFYKYYEEWGYDFIGFRLIYLSYWVRILIIMASWIIKKTLYFQYYFIYLVVFLLIVLEICFISINLLSFYVFFEISLIPTLLVIIGWGFQLERLQAGVYFIFYTLTASLPLLLNLIKFYGYNGFIRSERMLLRAEKELGRLEGILSFLGLIIIIMAFMVKLPIFFVHLWLPKAHVEAPVAGSIILAGVLLKLGGFGLCRIMPLVSILIIKFNNWIIGLGLIRIIYVGIMCCRLNDLKALVAYSSVAHMGLVFSGVVTLYRWGVRGGLIIIISHGLSSSGLFCLVNIYYERLRRRRIYLNKGLLLLFPRIRLMIFILCAANISAPPTINLIREIVLIIRVIRFRKIIIILFPLGSFLGAVFTLFLFSYSQHGKNYNLRRRFMGGKMIEYHSLMLHILSLNFIVIKVEIFFLYLSSLCKIMDCEAIEKLFLSN